MWPESSGENRLNADEAHEEANILRAGLNMRPEDSRRYFVGDSGRLLGSESLTAQDYDQALAVIEELKRAAAENPRTMSDMLYDLLKKSDLAVSLVFQLIDYYTGQIPKAHGDTRLSPLEAMKQRLSDAKYLNELNIAFTDAKNELEFLKKKGKEFGDKEQQHDRK